MAPTYFSFFNIDWPFICVAYQNLVFFLYTFQIPFWCGHIYSFSTQQHTAINNSLRIYMPINRKSDKATPPPHDIHTHTHHPMVRIILYQNQATLFCHLQSFFFILFFLLFFFLWRIFSVMQLWTWLRFIFVRFVRSVFFMDDHVRTTPYPAQFF